MTEISNGSGSESILLVAAGVIAGGFLCARSFVDSNFLQARDTEGVLQGAGQGGQYADVPYRV